MKKSITYITVMLAICFIAISMVACKDSARESGIETVLKAKKIRVGFSPGYMPFEVVDKTGSNMGFDIDIAWMIADAMGVESELVPVAEFDDLIPKLQKGEIDIILSGMTVTQKRNLSISFTEPYIITGQAILLNPKHKSVITSYSELNSAVYKVVYEKGTTAKNAIERLFPKCRFIAVTSADAGVKMVKQGEADAFVYDQPYCAMVIAREGNDKLVFLDQPITFEPIAIGVRHDDFGLLNWMNNFIRQIQSDGRYDDLYSKWFMENKWMKRLK